MNREIPYSKEEIAAPDIKKDIFQLFMAWGYSNVDIQYYEIWRRKRRK